MAEPEPEPASDRLFTLIFWTMISVAADKRDKRKLSTTLITVHDQRGVAHA